LDVSTDNEFRLNKYACVEEGLFYADKLGRKDRRVLQRYVDSPLNVPETETTPPQLSLKLMSRDFFLRQYFWGAVRRGDLIVGFNLPFDLSRLAVKYTNAKKGGWSLALSTRKNRKTGHTEINIERPRIVVTSINSKMAFFKLSSKWRLKEWRNEPRFLDLRTLTFSRSGIKNESKSPFFIFTSVSCFAKSSYFMLRKNMACSFLHSTSFASTSNRFRMRWRPSTPGAPRLRYSAIAWKPSP
jgi:hypothetical protein